MEEYLTIPELCGRIKYSKQSIYNMIYRKVFILNKHYVKPTPKKILFLWSAVKEWLEQEGNDSAIPCEDTAEIIAPAKPPTQDKPKSFINI